MRLSIVVLAFLSVLHAVAGCGAGSGAALQIRPYPGDRQASGRRLQALANLFEQDFACRETDTITIEGLAQGVYAVSGCNGARDYMLGCRAGGYSGQICNWAALPDLSQQAAIDLNCGAEYLDVQSLAPGQRSVDGCGYHATYALTCRGGCTWQLAGRIVQLPSQPGAAGAYTTPAGYTSGGYR